MQAFSHLAHSKLRAMHPFHLCLGSYSHSRAGKQPSLLLQTALLTPSTNCAGSALYPIVPEEGLRKAGNSEGTEEKEQQSRL